MEPKAFHEYFRKCYEIDNNRFSVENLGQAKYQYKHFIKEKEELLTGQYPILPLFHKKEEELLADITLYKLEKQLYYATFFVLGVNENTLSKNKNLFAPLILYPATIEKGEDNTSYIRINKQEGIVNRLVLNKFLPYSIKSSIEGFINDCERFFYEDITDAFLLKRSLEKYFKNVDAEELMYFPKVWSQAKITKYLRNSNQKGIFKIIPGALVSLVPKINNALKVITDLKKIEEQPYFGKPITELLNKQSKILEQDVDSVLKHQLNSDQFKALQNVQKYHNSVIVGPPGTGKSYTICAVTVDCILRGQSVLIVSKTKSAVEVLHNMLINDYRLKRYIIHTSGHSYKKSLEAKLTRLLGGVYGPNWLEEAYNKYNNDIDNLHKAEKEFLKRAGAEVDLGEINNRKEIRASDIFKKLYIKLFIYLDETIWDLLFEIENRNKSLTNNLKKYVLERIDYNVKNAVTNQRLSLVAYNDALQSENFSEYKRKVDTLNFDHIFKAFPLWLAHLSELNAVLPTHKELFDVVIIDEATQCDIASVLPAIYRAKKVVIAGDPKQLKHYSFISKKQQQQFRKKLSLPDNSLFNYRDKSILDVYLEHIQHQDQVSFLREHFRSSPKIIGFSNKKFYDNQLQVLKATPDVHKELKTMVCKCTGAGAKREDKGQNEIEGQLLLLTLDELISKHAKKPCSIGILSIFGDQVNYLKKELKSRYTLEILKKFDVLCGTPYHFQGNERDIMLLSFCIDNESHHSAFRYINRPDVLNVAITRAKQYQQIFHSLDVNKLESSSLLYEYLHFLEDQEIDITYEKPTHHFQKEVYDALKKKDYDDIIANYPLGGQILDLLVVKNDVKVFIDLIGDEGDFANHFSLERYKTFARIGVLSFPILYSLWKTRPILVINRLEKLLA